jgi:hypothetical protein
MRVSEMLTGSRGDVAVKLFGPDLNTLGDLAQRMAARVEKVPGARDVLTQASDSVEYLQVKVDAQAAGAGLAVTAVQDELRAQLEGVPAGLVIEPTGARPSWCAAMRRCAARPSASRTCGSPAAIRAKSPDLAGAHRHHRWPRAGAARERLALRADPVQRERARSGRLRG